MLEWLINWWASHSDDVFTQVVIGVVVGVVVPALCWLFFWFTGLWKPIWRFLWRFLWRGIEPEKQTIPTPLPSPPVHVNVLPVPLGTPKLDVKPSIRFGIGNPDDLKQWQLHVELEAQHGDIQIRDLYLETSSKVVLRPIFATKETNGWPIHGELVHTLLKGDKLTVIFGRYKSGDQGEIVAPDYDHAPWDSASTAKCIVVKTVEGDFHSLANSSIRKLAEAIARPTEWWQDGA